MKKDTIEIKSERYAPDFRQLKGANEKCFCKQAAVWRLLDAGKKENRYCNKHKLMFEAAVSGWDIMCLSWKTFWFGVRTAKAGILGI